MKKRTSRRARTARARRRRCAPAGQDGTARPPATCDHLERRIPSRSPPRTPPALGEVTATAASWGRRHRHQEHVEVERCVLGDHQVRHQRRHRIATSASWGRRHREHGRPRAPPRPRRRGCCRPPRVTRAPGRRRQRAPSGVLRAGPGVTSSAASSLSTASPPGTPGRHRGHRAMATDIAIAAIGDHHRHPRRARRRPLPRAARHPRARAARRAPHHREHRDVRPLPRAPPRVARHREHRTTASPPRLLGDHRPPASRSTRGRQRRPRRSDAAQECQWGRLRSGECTSRAGPPCS